VAVRGNWAKFCISIISMHELSIGGMRTYATMYVKTKRLCLHVAQVCLKADFLTMCDTMWQVLRKALAWRLCLLLEPGDPQEASTFPWSVEQV
jgi:hypothetical protein